MQYARLPWYRMVFLFIFRLVQLVVLSIAILPGTLLFSPSWEDEAEGGASR